MCPVTSGNCIVSFYGKEKAGHYAKYLIVCIEGFHMGFEQYGCT